MCLFTTTALRFRIYKSHLVEKWVYSVQNDIQQWKNINEIIIIWRKLIIYIPLQLLLNYNKKALECFEKYKNVWKQRKNCVGM